MARLLGVNPRQYQGFYSNIGRDNGDWRCFHCLGTLDGNLQRESLVREHARLHFGCRYLLKVKGTRFVVDGLPSEDLINIDSRGHKGSVAQMFIDLHSWKLPNGVSIKLPRYDNICKSMHWNRLLTFFNFPIRGPLASQLCYHGFFYDAADESVNCFWCNGSFDMNMCCEMSTDQQLDIVTLHSRRYTACGFVALRRGMDYSCRNLASLTDEEAEIAWENIKDRNYTYDVDVMRLIHKLRPKDEAYQWDEQNVNVAASGFEVTTSESMDDTMSENQNTDGSLVTDSPELKIALECQMPNCRVWADFTVLTDNRDHQCKVCSGCVSLLKINTRCPIGNHEPGLKKDYIQRFIKTRHYVCVEAIA